MSKAAPEPQIPRVKKGWAILSPFSAMARDLSNMFAFPRALWGAFFGTSVVCGGLVAFFIATSAWAESNEDEFLLEFEPGTLVRLGKKLEKKDLPEKIIVDEQQVETESKKESLTKEDKVPDPKDKPPKDKKKEAEKKKPNKKKIKPGKSNTKKNNKFDDLPTVDEAPGDPFGDPKGWTDLAKKGDPWATSVMAALNNLEIGAFAAKINAGAFKFMIKVCKDGRIQQVMQKKSSGDTNVDQAIKGALMRLKIPRPPPAIAKLMPRSCVSLKYVFVWSAGGTVN